MYQLMELLDVLESLGGAKQLSSAAVTALIETTTEVIAKRRLSLAASQTEDNKQISQEITLIFALKTKRPPQYGGLRVTWKKGC